MFYSSYLSLYLLQSLNLEFSLTQYVQEYESHTMINDLIEDKSSFLEDGPLFMQRLHEVHHPTRKSFRGKIKRRFGDTYEPATKIANETFKPLIADQAHDDTHPTSPETPIQNLYQSTTSMPSSDKDNPYNKDTILEENQHARNDYVDYNKALETTVQNVDKRSGTKITDDTSKAATERSILNTPNDPNPNMYDDYPTESKSSTQGLVYPMIDGSAFNPKLYDELNPMLTEKYIERYNTPVNEAAFTVPADGPAFDPKLYDEMNPMSKEKYIDRYNKPLYEGTFAMQYSDVNLNQPITTEKIIRKLNSTVLKKMADFLYPTNFETNIKKAHRSRQGELFFIPRPKSTNSNASQAIQKPVTVQKHRPALTQKSEYAIKETTNQILRKLKGHLISRPKLKQDYDAHFPKKETDVQRTRKDKPTLKHTRKAGLAFDRPQKHSPNFEGTVSQPNYPTTLDNIDYMQNHDFNSLKAATVSKIFSGTRKLKPSSKRLMNVTYLQKTKTTIQRFYKPLRNESDIEQKVNNGEVTYPIALETGPTFNQKLDVTIPRIVERINRTTSSTNSLSNLNPSFPSNLASNESPKMTYYLNLELTSLADIRLTATDEPVPVAESGLVYPSTQKAYPPEFDLALTASYPPTTELTTESTVYTSTTSIYDYQEIKAQALRTRAPEPTQLYQELYTIMAEPPQNPIFPQNFEPKQNYHDSPERILPKQVSSESFESKQALELQEAEGTEPFSTFLRKLMKVLASKSLGELRNLIEPFERYVIELLDSGKLMKLGIATGSFIVQTTPLLRAPVKEIQRHLFISQISLENRRRMLDDVTNEMLNELDDVYDVSEEEAMQRILHKITLYPNVRTNEEQIVKGFVNDIFLHPMNRVSGTPKGNVVFESIAKFANKYLLSIPSQARRNEKHEDHMITDPFSVREDLVRDSRKINKGKFINDFSSKGMKRKGGKIIINPYSSHSKHDSNDESGVEIKISINSGKHSKDSKIKFRRNSEMIENRQLDEKDGESQRNTERKHKRAFTLRFKI